MRLPKFGLYRILEAVLAPAEARVSGEPGARAE
jgi:hypothetical protein